MASPILSDPNQELTMARPVVTPNLYMDFYVALLRMSREDQVSVLRRSRVVQSSPSSDGLRTGRTLDSKNTARRSRL